MKTVGETKKGGGDKFEKGSNRTVANRDHAASGYFRPNTASSR